MTSETPVGCVCQMGELLLRPVGDAAPVTVVAAVVVWMHCTRGGCYWTRVGCTLGRWGLRAVRTTLGQWIPTLVEQADSRQSRRRVIASKPLRRRRAGNGGGEPATEAPGCAVRTPNSLLRGPVSTVLTLTGPTSMFPAGIVGILRFFSGVRLRCAFNVSTLDARTTSPTAPHRPRPHRLQGLSPPPGPRTLEEAARRRPPCAPRVRDGSGPDGAPASLGVPAGHRARR